MISAASRSTAPEAPVVPTPLIAPFITIDSLSVFAVGIRSKGCTSTDDIGSFAVAMSLDGADLERLSGDMLTVRGGANAQRPRGRVSGTLELSGSRIGAHSLTGRGQMRLKEATIYELPVVVALLKVLW